ncbi:MAG: acyl-CoA dehydrogenase family protein [Anaerolinea sp.]|nr:acyl-CoA dehydrogenase family protein [Anaerolinea sp.]
MISFTPSEEQQQLLDTIRRFAVNDVQPVAHEADENERVPGSVVQTGWDLGLIPASIPEDLGGFGELSAVTNVLAYEELAYGDLSTALHVMTPALYAYPIVLYGTAEQREVYMPYFLEERPAHATAALIEPGLFFDPNDLKTTATPEGDKIRINGSKVYVPMAATADWFLVYAKNADTGKNEAYIVNAETKGVTVGKREALMGVRALPTHHITLHDVVVNASCQIGGTVGVNYEALLNRSRVAIAAMAVGVARAAYDYAREYAKQRVQFGAPIATKQAIAFMLAEMAIEVDSARLMTWEAAWKLDRGEDATKEAYLAKEYASKAALTVADSAVQTLGGYGFIREYPVERYLRNARGFATFTGLAMV